MDESTTTNNNNTNNNNNKNGRPEIIIAPKKTLGKTYKQIDVLKKISILRWMCDMCLDSHPFQDFFSSLPPEEEVKLVRKKKEREREKEREKERKKTHKHTQTHKHTLTPKNQYHKK